MKTHSIRSRLTHVAAAILLCASAAAHAGSAPASMNGLPDHFLGVYLEPSSNAKLLAKLKAVCEKKGRVWAFGNSDAFRCYGMTYVPEAGDGPVYALDIATEGWAGGGPNAALENTVFSLKPFPAYEWKSRRASAAEIDGVSALFGKNKKEYKAIRAALVSGSAQVLDAPDRSKTLFIMLLEEARGVPEDADVTDLREVNATSALVVKEGGQYRRAGNVVGGISIIADLDGDGLPELVVDESCDGTCLAVISPKKPNGDNRGSTAVMGIMNH